MILFWGDLHIVYQPSLRYLHRWTVGTNGASIKDITQIDASGENVHAMEYYY